MVYRKHSPKSRRYKNSSSSHSHHQPVEEGKCIHATESIKLPEKKNSSNPFGLLTGLFNTGEKAERTGSPLFTIFDHDIYLDDLILIGLILLLLTDKVEDEILLIVLIYLLLDIF